MNNNEPHPTIPCGSQVVVRSAVESEDGGFNIAEGAVGEIVSAPDQPGGEYLVLFPDGRRARIIRDQLTIRKLYTRPKQSLFLLEKYNLYGRVIFRCIAGSRAYGLEDENSDFDRRGIYMAPADLEWSIIGAPEQLENKEADECYWELKKFIGLALKANPNILECLYSPLVEHASGPALDLIAKRDIFLSKLLFQTYNGYAVSQFKKMEQDLRRSGKIREKHAMHLIRLLITGIKALKEGVIQVRVHEHRNRLLDIKKGLIPWNEINEWRLELHREFNKAYESTRLPDWPDYDAADRLLIRARLEAVKDLA